MANVTKPIALDETLQTTNSKMDSVVTKLQGIIDALGLDTSVYKAAGSKQCSELLPGLLIKANLGNVYNITDSGTTTSDFVEGSGKPIHIGDNVAVVDVGSGGTSVYKFDLLAGMVDLTNYVQKSNTSGLVKNDGTIDTNTYQQTESGKGLSTNDYDDTEKGKVASATSKLSDESTEVEGNPINFTTLSAQNAKSTILSLEPIQDLHGYDKPWVGGAGKNLFNPDTFVRGLLNANTGEAEGTTVWITSDYIKIQGTVTIQGWKDGSESNFCVRFCEYDADKSFIKNTSNINVSDAVSYLQTITLDSNTRYIRASFGFDNKTTTISDFFATNRIMLELGSTAHTYEPYENICPISGRTEIGILGTNGKESTDPDYEVSTDLIISLGQTVYGGTLDVENGVLVVDRARVDLGSLTWTYNNGVMRSSVSGVKMPPDYITKAEIISEIYEVDTSYNVNSNTTPYTIAIHNVNEYLWVYDPRYSDPAIYKTAMDGIQLCYALATPITYQLTPYEISLLEGVNNISVDDDFTSISLTYRDGSVATLGDLLEVEKKIPSATAQHNYSTEEQVVGTWIDGKPLYEKTFEKTIPESTSNATLISSTELPNAIIHFMDGHIESMPLNCYFESNGFSVTWGYGGNTVLYRCKQWGATSLATKIIVRYIKTTD